MDANLSSQEEQQILNAIDDYAAAPRPEGGAGDLFCQHWELVKEILGFLKDKLPQPIPMIIGILIKFGDIAHDKWCPKTS